MRQVLVTLAVIWLGWLCGTSYAQDTRLNVIPGADRLREAAGDPPVHEAFAGGRSMGFVFSSAQVAATTGYGGKPLDILIGIDHEARITGVEILQEHEPILATGRTREDLEAFAGQFAGRDLRGAITLIQSRDDGLDAVSGATITSLIMSDAILTTSREVARKLGLIDQGGVDLDSFVPLDWDGLMQEGLIAHRRILIGEAQDEIEAKNAQLFPPAMGETDPQARLIDLYVALATPAMTGRNLLGSERHDRWRAEHTPGDQAIWIGGDGRYSFKGTSWRQSGIFDRLRLIQDGRSIELDAGMHTSLAETTAPGLREQALFTLPPDSGFRADRPFDVELWVTGHASPEIAARFAMPYALPETLIVPQAGPTPVWLQIWQDRKLDIAVLLLALSMLTVMLVLEDMIAQRPKLWRVMRLGFLTFTLVWLGAYATAQLSVVNVLTFAHALRADFHWEQFLIEPLIFILWSFVAMTLLFWGRGVFCGWLCPFGALQEMLWTVARKIRLPVVHIPFALHERLRAIKFLVFLGLAAVSLGSVSAAHQLAEIEPFKTVIVLKFHHALPFIGYALVILAVSLFIQRVFCRYICPLGAALALPARLKQFDWLKRRWQCGQRCHICAGSCPVQAIQPSGDIHPGECIYCLRCQTNYFNATLCPPLIERSRRAEARAKAAQSG